MFEIFPIKIQKEITDKFSSEFNAKFEEIGHKTDEILLKIIDENGEIFYIYAIYEKDKIYIFTDAKSPQFYENFTIFICKNAKDCENLAFQTACRMIFEFKCSK